MEERKQKEIEFYDNQAGQSEGDFEGFLPQRLLSYRFLYDLLKDKCRDKKILDFGCGNGVHSVFLAREGGQVTAIDLSENQLVLAKKRIEKSGLFDKVNFIKMDCEKLNFPNESFDIIFNGGTFSSIDLKSTLPQLAKVLKKDGFLVGIETFGHNPITNLKRKLNAVLGKRTSWAEEHIFNQNYLALANDYFGQIKVDYFHLISWAAFPFLDFPGGNFLLKFLEFFDKVFLKIPFLKKYTFKVVFVFSQPK
jgi:ubiquinone/menaquinone biosynthesis C-methylase UbiE